jgi:hypothetical protein
MISLLLSVSILVSWYKNSGTVLAVGVGEPDGGLPSGPMFATWSVVPSRIRLLLPQRLGSTIPVVDDEVAEAVAAAATAAAAAVAAAEGGGNDGNGGTGGAIAAVFDDNSCEVKGSAAAVKDARLSFDTSACPLWLPLLLKASS